jgi:thymidylate synthase
MIVHGNSITECWLKILIAVADGTSSEISPLVANFFTDNPAPDYQEELEHDLNEFLQSIKQNSIETTASTIFPKSLCSGDQTSVFKRFDSIWKYVKKNGQNKYGHYFRRLIAFNEASGKPINQLQHIIETYNGIEGLRNPVHRRSALIALTFDPSIDHTSQALRGFPCLQQVCFIPKKNGKMTLNAIYAMQHLANRGYGNYLGLQNLGNFMAREMGLELDEVNCVASVLELGKMNKSTAREFVKKYRKYV